MNYTYYFYTTRFRAAAVRLSTRLAVLAPCVLLLALLIPTSQAQIIGTGEDRDLFGWVVASGDFNADGVDDLAIGVHGENQGEAGQGGVHIVYGTNDRLDQAGNQFYSRTEFGKFGWSLAAGDWNGDGFDDLAVGNPDGNGVGLVLIIFGGPAGLGPGDAFDLARFGINGIPGALFGYSLAAGDFDNDGRDDLVIGVPGSDVPDLNVESAGEVFVVYGGTGSLDFNRFQTFRDFSLGQTSDVESGDNFGQEVGVGDFNGDGFDDLIVGAPFEDTSVLNGGAVGIAYGSSSGLTTDGAQYFSESDLFGGENQEFGVFGFTLSAGDFDGDGFDDLVTGSFVREVGSVREAGVVRIVYGAPSGINSSNRTDTFDSNRFTGVTPKFGESFGYALAAGDFDGDGRDDLGIGSPRSSFFTGVARAGIVYVAYGSASGIAVPGVQGWNEDNIGNPSAEFDDQFGWALAAGNFNGDGRDDLAIGVPYEDLATGEDVGKVIVLYGNANGEGRPSAGLSSSSRQSLLQGLNVVGTSSEDAAAPAAFALDAAAPNPFTEATQLRFTLATADHARLAVYDVLGRQVALLADGTRAAGAHEVTFDAAGLPAGLYVVRLTTDRGEAQTRRITVVR